MQIILFSLFFFFLSVVSFQLLQIIPLGWMNMMELKTKYELGLIKLHVYVERAGAISNILNFLNQRSPTFVVI